MSATGNNRQPTTSFFVPGTFGISLAINECISSFYSATHSFLWRLFLVGHGGARVTGPRSRAVRKVIHIIYTKFSETLVRLKVW